MRPNPQWFSKLFTDAGFFRAFAESDVHSPHFGAILHKALDAAASRLWAELQAAFPATPVSVILRNSWSVAAEPPMLAALFRAARLSAKLDSDSRKVLKAISAKLPNGDKKWWGPIASEKLVAVPDLSRALHFTPALRYRYALSRGSSETLIAERCISSWTAFPGCSRLAGQRELLKAVNAASEHHRPVKRITIKQLRSLPLANQRLVTTDSTLLEELVSPSRNLSKFVVDVEKAWSNRAVTKRALLDLQTAIRRRDTKSAETIASSIRPSAVTPDLSAMLLKLFGSAIARPSPTEPTKWSPLGPKTLQIARLVLDSPAFGGYLKQLPTSILCAIASGTFLEENIAPADLERISSSLRASDLVDGRLLTRLARSPQANKSSMIHLALERSTSGAYDAKTITSLLNDRRCELLRTLVLAQWAGADKVWIEGLRKLFASRKAKTLLPRDSVELASRMLKLLLSDKSGQHPSEIQALTTYVANNLRAQASSAPGKAPSQAWIAVTTQLSKHFPGAASKLVSALDRKPTVKLLQQPELQPLLLATISSDTTDPVLRQRARQLLLPQLKSSELLSLLSKEPTTLSLLRADQTPSFSQASSQADIEARFLWLRYQPHQLRQFARSIGEDESARAARALAKRLSPTSRDRGYLELVAELGIRWIKPLARILATCNRKAPAGHKLDRAYRQYQLPKRSGGKRTISVPSPILKSLQRRILKTIFGSLRSHEAAFGFTSGRSIVQNAAVHVGNEVVVNCDVQNCFPSVRWSLVLGVLRLDLAKKLSPAAISLLVDICTMSGALPIGAPTSPTLLNRVLLRTDDQLTSAAAIRGCRYSRYADDLTFSGDSRAVELLGVAKRTLSQIGLQLDARKTNIYRKGRRQIVTGLVVNERVSVPRRLRRRMRAAVHAVESGNEPKWHKKRESIAALRGRLQFTRSANEREATALLDRLNEAVDELGLDDDPDDGDFD